jgi:hypothetical protein
LLVVTAVVPSFSVVSNATTGLFAVPLLSGLLLLLLPLIGSAVEAPLLVVSASGEEADGLFADDMMVGSFPRLVMLVKLRPRVEEEVLCGKRNDAETKTAAAGYTPVAAQHQK